MKNIYAIIFVLFTMASYAQNPAGKCYDVDYDTFLDDGLIRYIDLGNDDAFNTGDNLTIEGWVKAYDFAWNQKIAGKTNLSFNSGYIYGVGEGGIYHELFNPSQNTTLDGFIPPTPELSYYKHIAWTYEAGEKMISYINGVQVAEYNVGNTDINSNNDKMVIGVSPWGDYNAFMFFGQLDEFRVWNVARTVEEINASMFVPIDPNTEGLVGYYQFNEDSGEVIDSSPNALNGQWAAGADDSNRTDSWAVVGTGLIESTTDVHGLWNGIGLVDPRFTITENGLSMTASGMIEGNNYSVFGHNDASGLTTAEVPAGAPAGFQRLWREWYVQSLGDMTADLSFNLNQAAGGGDMLDDSQPAQNYTLMIRDINSDEFTFIDQAEINSGTQVIVFEDVPVGTYYVTIGVGSEPATVSVNEAPSAKELSIYPNPAISILNIVTDQWQNEPVMIDVFDMAGKRCMNEVIIKCANITDLDISGLSSGNYFVRLTASGDVVYNGKFLKE